MILRRNGTRALPQDWDDPENDPADVTVFSEVELQVIGTPSVAYEPKRSLDGETFITCNVFDKDLNLLTTIIEAGMYSLDGGGWIKLTGGSGSTVSIRASE